MIDYKILSDIDTKALGSGFFENKGNLYFFYDEELDEFLKMNIERFNKILDELKL